MSEIEGNYQGLSVAFYDLWFPGSFGREMEFLRERLKKQGGSVLEVACGTGRVMLDFLEVGIDIEGVDISPEMLAQARKNASKRNLQPVLYESKMQELDTGKTYDSLIVPGQSFLFVIDREEAKSALLRFHQHLKPGGQLIMSMFNASFANWKDEDGRLKLYCTGIPLDNGKEGHIYGTIQNDFTNQMKYCTQRYEIYSHGVLEKTEVQKVVLRWYTMHEFILLLEQAGFKDIEVCGDYTGKTLSDQHSVAVYCARKPQ